MNNLARHLAILQIYLFLYNIINFYFFQIGFQGDPQQWMISGIYFTTYLLILRYLLSRKVRILFNPLKTEVVFISSSDVTNFKNKAYLGLGRVYRKKRDNKRAVDNFMKAKKNGSRLSNDELLFTGNSLAEKQNKFSDAIQLYVDCLSRFPVDNKEIGKIYSLTHNLCKITKTTRTFEICHTVNSYKKDI